MSCVGAASMLAGSQSCHAQVAASMLTIMSCTSAASMLAGSIEAECVGRSHKHTCKFGYRLAVGSFKHYGCSLLQPITLYLS